MCSLRTKSKARMPLENRPACSSLDKSTSCSRKPPPGKVSFVGTLTTKAGKTSMCVLQCVALCYSSLSKM